MSTTQLIHRISRIQGQLEALKRQLHTSDLDCHEVLQLAKTTQRALESFTQAFTTYQFQQCFQDEQLPKETRDKVQSMLTLLTSRL